MLYDVTTTYAAHQGSATEFEALSIINRNPEKNVEGFEVSTYQVIYIKHRTLPECLAIFDEIVPNNKKTLIGAGKYVIYNNKVAVIADNNNLIEPLKAKNRQWNISLYGQQDIVYNIYEDLNSRFNKETDVFV